MTFLQLIENMKNLTLICKRNNLNYTSVDDIVLILAWNIWTPCIEVVYKAEIPTVNLRNEIDLVIPRKRMLI